MAAQEEAVLRLAEALRRVAVLSVAVQPVGAAVHSAEVAALLAVEVEARRLAAAVARVRSHGFA